MGTVTVTERTIEGFDAVSDDADPDDAGARADVAVDTARMDEGVRTDEGKGEGDGAAGSGPGYAANGFSAPRPRPKSLANVERLEERPEEGEARCNCAFCLCPPSSRTRSREPLKSKGVAKAMENGSSSDTSRLWSEMPAKPLFRKIEAPKAAPPAADATVEDATEEAKDEEADEATLSVLCDREGFSTPSSCCSFCCNC